MHQRKYFTIGSLWGLLGFLGTGITFAAQTAEGLAKDDVLEEVIVTARRAEENLQEVPVAVTQIAAAQIEQRGIRSAFDLNTYVPALHVATYNNKDSLVVGIRGQRNSQIQPGQDPSIGVYFAEVPTGFQIGLNMGMFDLDNIQVLKGPQGTLFGRNSTGGAVLIGPARPTDQFEGSVKIGSVNFAKGNGVTSQAMLNMPISDTLAVRFAIDTVDQDGYVRNVATPTAVTASQIYPAPAGPSRLNNLGSQDSQAWRASIAWKPTDQIRNDFIYQGYRYRSNGLVPTLRAVRPGAPFAAVLNPELARVQAAQGGYFWSVESGSESLVEVNQDALFNTTVWQLGDITLKNIWSSKVLRGRRVTDSVGIPQEYLVTQYSPQGGHEWSEEFQLQGKSLDRHLDWVAGLFYYSNWYNSVVDPSLQLIPLLLKPSRRSTYTVNKTRAIFGQGTYHFANMEGLSATLGYRVTTDERSMLNESTQVAPGGAVSCQLRDANGALLPLSACRYEATKSFHSPTWTAGLDYKINATTMVYASRSRGYRAGGFNAAGLTVGAFQPFLPEIVYNNEIGLKADWDIGIPVRTNVAVYRQDYTDIQRIAQDTAALAAARLFNATKATIDGYEAEITLRPTHNLQIGATYAHVNPKYTQSFFNSLGGAGCAAGAFASSTCQDVAQNTFGLVPKATFTLNATYKLPLDSNIGTVSVSADYYHQSRMYFDDTLQGSIAGPLDAQSSAPYGLWNARIDWKDVMKSQFDIALWVKNAGNVKYYTSAIPVYTSTVGTWSNYVGEPRMVGVEFKWNFGR